MRLSVCTELHCFYAMSFDTVVLHCSRVYDLRFRVFCTSFLLRLFIFLRTAA